MNFNKSDATYLAVTEAANKASKHLAKRSTAMSIYQYPLMDLESGLIMLIIITWNGKSGEMM